MAKFSVGEIAIITRKGQIDDFTGKECEILTEEYNYRGETGYDIMVNGERNTATASLSGEYFIDSAWLRKKQPPKESKDITETRKTPTLWDKCVWSPNVPVKPEAMEV